MSHDRGCSCGREKYEYDDCKRADCFKKEQKVNRFAGLDGKDVRFTKEKTMGNEQKANEYQQGGTHYRKGDTTFQHWDLIERYGLGYLEGYASKYVVRWRERGVPRTDIEKAIHIVGKLLELHEAGLRENRSDSITADAVHAFCDQKNITNENDRYALVFICTWRTQLHLQLALNVLDKLHAEALEMVKKDIRMVGGARPEDKTGQARPFGYDPDEEQGR